MPFATLVEIVRHQAATRPKRVALTFEDRDRLSFLHTAHVVRRKLAAPELVEGRRFSS